ncbi:MAG: M20 family metallopeptidase [Clostridia bacterium]|nr:M20 family metallopeptidase [Clostridia bacterium]
MFTEEIKALAAQYAENAVNIRRMLHTMPELEFNEFKTSGYIASVLDTLSIPYKRGYAGGTGICAVISGAPEGRTVAVRADIDALPITEETNLPFASEHEGCMHACGHDAHVAIALCTAFILNELKDSLSGSIKFFFQPAEEGEGGAEKMIEEGVLQSPKVDVCIGGHVMPDYPTGTIAYRPGPLMASPDNFEIEVIGEGGHGAYPEKCVNPIVAAAEIIKRLTALTDKNVPRVVSVCTIDGGRSENVIPTTVRLRGTARTFTPEERETLSLLIGGVAKEAAAEYGAAVNYKFIPLYPALINNDKITDMFVSSAKQILGEAALVKAPAVSMTGDDFSYFARAVPSTYVHIGCRNESVGAIYPLHHSKFTVDEAAIPIAAMCYAQFAVDYLGKR